MRLGDLDELFRAINKIKCSQGASMGDGLADACQAVLEAPTVDAAEVVRCKDCKHWHEEQGWCDEHSHFIDSDRRFCHPWESCEWKMFEPDDFCSYGEKRTVTDNG